MPDSVLGPGGPRDLPVCLPGRQCVDQPPLSADLIDATLRLTPSSPVIAAACFAVLGASAVLLGLSLRSQWRGAGVRPWTAVLVTAMLLVGVATAWVVDGFFRAVASIYSDAFGEPSAPAPAALTGSWPSVLVAGYAMAGLAAVAILVMLNTAAVRHRRRHPG